MSPEPFRMPVELGKVREFARAVKSADQFDRDDLTPASPATFLASAVLWQDERHSAWGSGPRAMERVLHGAVEFLFPDGPPPAGCVLTGQAEIGDVREKQGRRGGAMTFTDVVTRFASEQGRPVATYISTSIVTSKPAS
jgi:N-terminal half of MaoC dehydratase